MNRTLHSRIVGSAVLVLTTVLGPSEAQDVPKTISLTPSAEFRLCPELDAYAVRDIEWFAKLPSKGAMFVRRELPYGTFSLVILNERFEVVSDVKLDLPWKKHLTGFLWCAISPDLFAVVLKRPSDEAPGGAGYALFEPKSGKRVSVGVLKDVDVRSLRPVWRKGCIVWGVANVVFGPTTSNRPVLMRLDKEMGEVWRIDDPIGDGDCALDMGSLRVLDKSTVGILRENPLRIVRMSMEDGSCKATPVTIDGQFHSLVDGNGTYAPILTGGPGAQEVHYVDSTGAVVHRRQVSAPLESRRLISAKNVSSDARGNLWLTDGKSIFQIDSNGDAHKLAGPESDSPLLAEIGPLTVNRHGQIICQDILSGTLFKFDRDGKRLRAEPTSTVHFPTVCEEPFFANIESFENGDVFVMPPRNTSAYIRFGPDLEVKANVKREYQFISIQEETSTICEWDLHGKVRLRRPGKKSTEFSVKGASVKTLFAARLLENDSLATLLPGKTGMTLACQTMDGSLWFKTSTANQFEDLFLSVGKQWVCASSIISQGLLVDIESKQSFRFDVSEGKPTEGRLRYFIDVSQPSGEELVEVNCLTRVVRRFPLPNVDIGTESKPAVK